MKRLTNTRFACLVIACALCVLIGMLVAGCSTSSPAQADSQKSDSDETLVSAPVEEIDYASGIHHAELVFEGYESSPLSIDCLLYTSPSLHRGLLSFGARDGGALLPSCR